MFGSCFFYYLTKSVHAEIFFFPQKSVAVFVVVSRIYTAIIFWIFSFLYTKYVLKPVFSRGAHRTHPEFTPPKLTNLIFKVGKHLKPKYHRDHGDIWGTIIERIFDALLHSNMQRCYSLSWIFFIFAGCQLPSLIFSLTCKYWLLHFYLIFCKYI